MRSTPAPNQLRSARRSGPGSLRDRAYRRELVSSTRNVGSTAGNGTKSRNAHLYSFTAGSVTYGDAEPELGFADDAAVRLGDLDADSLEYTYDFGDSWDHLVTVESSEEAVAGRRYPWCLDGEGACPPEDCGGVPGYERLREILDDPTDEEHTDMLAWSGVTDAGEFDPAAFDLDATNRALATLVALR